MIDFSTLKGLAIPEGNVTQITDASGRVLWTMSGMPNDSDTGLMFNSPLGGVFTIEAQNPNWDGKMEYCNSSEGWKIWDGSKISSAILSGVHRIYIRGTQNTVVSAGETWSLEGKAIRCDGNIDNLLDYQTVQAGNHPYMEAACFDRLFFGCTGLVIAPSLPATTLAPYCYYEMFRDCTGLVTVPKLPATILEDSCYFGMFNGCQNIRLSASKTSDIYTTAYRIPTSGTGQTATDALTDMFAYTGGTFEGTPSINTSYYLAKYNYVV